MIDNVVTVAAEGTVAIAYVRARDEVSQLTWYRKTITMNEWEFVGQFDTDRMPHPYAPPQFSGKLPAAYDIRVDGVMRIGPNLQPFGRLQRIRVNDALIHLLFFGNAADADPNTVVTFTLTFP
jgi:hypothetical protein